SNWQYLQAEFPDEYLQAVLYRAEKKETLEGYITPIYSRILAFILDFLIVFFFVSGFDLIFKNYFAITYDSNTINPLILMFVLLQRVLMESFFMTRRSFGKITKKLYILDINGFYTTKKISIYRHLLIILYFVPLMNGDFGFNIDDQAILIYLLVVVFGNLYLYLSKGCLFHDLITKTRVLYSD
ncbi:MAG: RDD family protein, partial [Alcanivoracaceae bacterium]|nr:RDD family protein [Alcanivoracaceae bacterium]